MPTHYPAGPWIRTSLFWKNQESQWQNDLWFKVTGAVPADTDINTVAAAVDTALMGPFTAAASPDATYLGNTTWLNNGTYTISAETSQATSGGASGDGLPSEDAVIVRLNSGVATRAGEGRIFVGGVASENVDDSKLTPDGVALYIAIKTALLGIETLGGVTAKVAVWSRKLGAIEPVTSIALGVVLGHRRKRRPQH